MTGTLPSFVLDLIRTPPRAGEGIHRWLFRVARQLHAHLPAGAIITLLRSRVRTCGRHVPDSEIVAAVQNSLACAWQPRGASVPLTRAAPKWPAINLERVEAICSEGYGLADLWEASPIRIEDSEQHTETIVDRLFPGNPLLCCGRSKSVFDTRTREQWRGELAKLQFIVPNPMSALIGMTKEGRQSTHTLSNTGPRRFLVVECDYSIYARDGKTETRIAPLVRKLAAQSFSVGDMCAAVLLHLARFAPMVCAVHSGGKSIHGSFFLERQPEERVLKFFRYAVSLGADPATWTRSQFVRMPDGMRDNGKRQTVFFLSFKPLENSL